MDYSGLAHLDVNSQSQGRNPVRNRTRANVIMHVTAFGVITAAGFILGGAKGAATVAVWWAVVLIVRRRLLANNAQAGTGPETRSQSLTYEHIEDVNDCLEDIARRRNWDLDKRFDIARMACENRTTTFDELERRYDRGVRSEFSRRRQDTSQQP